MRGRYWPLPVAYTGFGVKDLEQIERLKKNPAFIQIKLYDVNVCFNVMAQLTYHYFDDSKHVIWLIHQSKLQDAIRDLDYCVSAGTISKFEILSQMKGVKTIAVLYHYPCMDGIFAAYIAKHSLPAEATEFHPHSTTKAFDLTQISETVEELYLLDYCGPEGFLERICKHFKRVVLIDHHQTALDYLERLQNDMPANLETFVKTKYSACMLAERWFQPVGLSDQFCMLMKYVQDNDLWQHELPKSEECTAGLMSLKLDPTPAMFDVIPTLRVGTLIKLGEPEIQKRNAYADEHVKRASFHVLPDGLFDEKKVALVQFDTVPEYISYLGDCVCQLAESKVGIIAFPIADGTQIKLSVRSEEDVDTLVLTSKYKGGGHKNASGCVISKEEFNKLF